MRLTVFTLILTALIMVSFSRADDSAPGPTTRPAKLRKDVGVEEFSTLQHDEKNVVLDVRTPEEFQKGHLARAVNVDISSQDFEKKMKEMDKDHVYLVYCAVGVRSARACDKLEKIKFVHLYNLLGGYTAWQKDHKPVEK